MRLRKENRVECQVLFGNGKSFLRCCLWKVNVIAEVLEVNKLTRPCVPFRPMLCGFHHCERLCHSDACGECVAQCGKSRKAWLVLHSVSSKSPLMDGFFF